MTTPDHIAAGKPPEFGQELLTRRARICRNGTVIPIFSWLPHTIHRIFALARIYRRRDIVDLLQDAGFRVEFLSYLTAPLDVLTITWLQRLPHGNLFREDVTSWSILAPAIVVHCTAPEAQ